MCAGKQSLLTILPQYPIREDVPPPCDHKHITFFGGVRARHITRRMERHVERPTEDTTRCGGDGYSLLLLREAL